MQCQLFFQIDLHCFFGCPNITFANNICRNVKLNAREKTLGAGEKLEDFETHFRIINNNGIFRRPELNF
jgi:hypothetical protein